MDFLPTPPTLTLTQIIVKREDKDTKLVVRGSFGNTQEGGIGEWEGSEGLWGEETTALFKLHTPCQGAGQRAVVEGSLGLCLLLPLVIVLEDTPLLNLWDERHSPPAQSADARQRGSLPQPDFYLGQSTADAPRVLVDGAVLKDREDSGKGWVLRSDRLGLILIDCGSKGKLLNLSVTLGYRWTADTPRLE